jgi:hypothetical protein
MHPYFFSLTCTCVSNIGLKQLIVKMTEINISLQILSLRAMRSETLMSIDSTILYLLVPSEIQTALSTFQLVIRRRRLVKMEALSRLQRLLDTELRKDYLKSNGMTLFNPVQGAAIIRPGEHIAVFGKIVFHHGIYIGLKDGDPTVLDNSDKKEANGKSIQYRRLTDFVGDSTSFGIVKCRCPEGTDEESYRQKVVTLATLMEQCDHESVQTYRLLKWNCESFAWFCSSLGTKCNSEEAEKLFLAFLEDISKGDQSVLISAAYLGSQSSGCVVM